MRKGGRAHGSAVYYSALTALATQARPLGDEDAARRLTDEGHQIEETFTHLLQVLLSTRSVEALASAPFHPDLVSSTQRALDFAWESGSGELIVGQVKSVRQDLAQIAGTYLLTGAGAPLSAVEGAYFASWGDDDMPEARILRLAG